MKLKKKNLQIIKKQSSIYRDMIMTTVKQSNFKRYYMKNFERIVNKNFKGIKSGFVNKYLDYQIELNCVYVSGCEQNRHYDEDENMEYEQGQLLSQLNQKLSKKKGKVNWKG
jgi:hypothetical protein